jgi:hypothetical protein
MKDRGRGEQELEMWTTAVERGTGQSDGKGTEVESDG